jgi:N-dimethylarginine dimethylaminohydrolase
MQLLMCPPDYYGIEYEINPWMSRSHQSNPVQAQQQWDALRRLLQDRLAVDVRLVEAQLGLPDMVFTANAGLVWQNQFIASNFRHDVRRREAAHFEEWFRHQGFQIVRLPQEHCFEGEGDLLKCGDSWLAGYHIRSDIASHHKISEIIEQEILSLELTNQWFYHLDTCICPVSDKQALFYAPAFDPYAQRVLENHIPHLIAVSTAEAARFACNAIVAGKCIVMNDGCPKVREQLEDIGFTVFETSLSEFLKAGGSAKCLALIIQ